jgi:signal transduction histidine kinase
MTKPTDAFLNAPRVVPQLTTLWWIPSAVVVLSLLLLLVLPVEIDRRASSIRESVTAGEHARTVLNDFEAALATDLLVRTGGSPAVAKASADSLDAELADLHTALHRIDEEGLAGYDSVATLLDAWRASLRDGDSSSRRRGLELIAAAETLDGYLAHFVDSRRARSLALNSYYFSVPAVLAPIAVLAMLLASWMARRTQLLARVAEAERAEVVRASESRAALLRGVTHDVKNPLGAARGYAQLLEEGIVGPLAAPQAEMVQRIRHLLTTSIQTVTDLLELARTDGTLQIEYAMTDLGVAVNEVVADHRGMALEHGLVLDVAAVDPPTPVMTDPLRVRQVLANLLTNAIKYTPSGGHVGVNIVRDSARIGVAIQDTGPGIPRELERKLFEEFFRVRSEATGSGNGLGLAISRRIARLLGGDVVYRRNDGQGSVFTLWLPHEHR